MSRKRTFSVDISHTEEVSDDDILAFLDDRPDLIDAAIARRGGIAENPMIRMHQELLEIERLEVSARECGLIT